MDTNVATTAGAPVDANMAMTQAVAVAINPSCIAKTIVSPSSTSKQKTKPVTASGMTTALTSSKARLATSETPDGKPDPMKKAISNILRKKEKEKIQATKNSEAPPGEWSHPTATKAVMGTDIRMKDCIYTPVKKDITQTRSLKLFVRLLETGKTLVSLAPIDVTMGSFIEAILIKAGLVSQTPVTLMLNGKPIKLVNSSLLLATGVCN